MNLYLITQTINTDYATYDSAVVAAETEEVAKKAHPSHYPEMSNRRDYVDARSWAPPEDVTVRLLAENVNEKAGVILASFNAG